MLKCGGEAVVEWKSLICNLEWGPKVLDYWRKAIVVLVHK